MFGGEGASGSCGFVEVRRCRSGRCWFRMRGF